jgi:hypothetical protein
MATVSNPLYKDTYLETDPRVIRDYLETKTGTRSPWTTLGGMLLRRLGPEERDGQRQTISTLGYVNIAEGLIGDIITRQDGVFGDPIPPVLTDSSFARPEHQRQFLIGLAGAACGPEFGTEVRELAEAAQAATGRTAA